MNNFLQKIIVFLILISSLSFVWILCFGKRSQNNYFKDYKTIHLKINKRKFRLYVADNPQKREKGLSNIPSLQDNEGMIFLFDEPGYHSFWMKDMRFPLDFIFVRDDKVVDFLEDIKPQTYPRTFTAKKPADKVIELKAGVLKELGRPIEIEF
jgi:uncharacterized membrane protein (UPF0127 family)